MVLHVYAVCYNETVLLPYFLRYYTSLADKVVIFDASTDPSAAAMVSRFGNVVRIPSSEVRSDDHGKMSESILIGLRNEGYKESRGKADWVIVADIDEIVYHPRLLDLLARYKREGTTILRSQGFEMVSSRPPSTEGQIYEEIFLGFRNHYYSKCAVFQPGVDIRYSPGCHSCSPAGNVVIRHDPTILLLHYRFLGSNFFCGKYLARQDRLSQENVEQGWATHLTLPGKAASGPLFPTTADQLKKRYYEILRDQKIIDVLEGKRIVAPELLLMREEKDAPFPS
jgi:hypothetical protein